jgi:hypothetical protein
MRGDPPRNGKLQEEFVRVRTLGLLLVMSATQVGGCGSAPEGDRDPAQSEAGDGDHATGGDMRDREPVPADAECSMAGLWAVRQTNYQYGLVESVTSGWSYLEIEQDGAQLVVVDSIDCGYAVIAAGTTGLTSQAAVDPLTEHNSQVGRRGTLERSGEHCNLTLERFWTIRGAQEDTFLPGGHADPRELSEVRAEAPLPTADAPTGQEDWDHDGHPGITLFIGNNDARYSASREWTEWFSCNGSKTDRSDCKAGDADKYALVPGQLTDFQVRMSFDNEDSVLGASSPLYAQVGTPVLDADSRVTLKFLGADRKAELAAMLWSKPDAAARCTVIRQLLPADAE